MLIEFAQNLSLSADSGATDVTTDPDRVGPRTTKLQVTMLTHQAYATSGSFTIEVRVQGSNDGQTWFYAASDIPDISETTVINAETSGPFLFAYARLEISLTTPVGDQAYWVGDVHVEGKRG
jgi:hypothetical protein